MTADAIRAALERLREAGAKLRRRPARETFDALARTIDAWGDASSPWRRELEAELPAATGFSRAMVREGLARGFGAWSGEDLHRLVARELGPPERLDAATPTMLSGPGATAVLLAGAIPMPTLLDFAAPLALRSPVVAKTASRDPVTAAIVARSLADADSELGGCVEVVSFPGADAARIAALLEADCVVASGSDATLAAVAARVQPPTRLVAHPHRFSVAALGPESTRGAPLDDAARRLALDVALWDQLGCLSPICVYVADAGAVDRVAEALAATLSDAERRWPRGAIEAEDAERIARGRAEAEMRAAAGRRVALHCGEGTSWTVVCEADAAVRDAPLHRFLRVHPVRDAGGLLDALRPLAPQLAAVAVAGFGADAKPLARALADVGASRICAPGELQSPPLGWRRDNRAVLLPIARLADLETA